MTRGSAVVFAAFVVLAASVACSGDDDGDGGTAGATTTTAGPTTTERPNSDVLHTASPPQPPGVHGTLVQYREDEVLGLVQAQIRNDGAEPIHVTELAIRWDGFEPLDPAPVDHSVAPGVTLDMPVRFGASRCADPPRPDDEPPDTPVIATGTVTVGAGGSQPLEVTLVDGRDIAGKVFRIGCRRQAVEWAAPVGFGDGWVTSTYEGHPAVTGELVVERNHGDGPVDVLDVDGSVLLAVRPTADTTPLARMAADEDRAGAEVTVTSTGLCTGHALADSKKTFIFHVLVDIGGPEPIGYEVRPDPALQAMMQDVIDGRCGSA